MFSYYGSKSKIVHLYPAPKHRLIIEPFAGSARYALKYFDRDVLLIDKYEVVVKIWKWLQQCSESDILKLPNLDKGVNIKTLNLCEEEKLFLGMISGVGVASPQYTVSKFAAEQNCRKNQLKRISEQLYKIRHWNIKQGCYTETENQTATWFIDPPYQFGGQFYVHSEINFRHLSVWSRERAGQVIVCENAKTNWMPFKVLTTGRSGIKKQNEVFWTNEKVEVQAELF